MDKKLEKLLKEIKLNEENFKYFTNGEVKKVVVYDENKYFEFVIELDSNLPYNVYIELINKLKETFSNKKLDLILKVRNKDANLFMDYFKVILDNLIEKSRSLEVVRDYKVELIDNIINIEVLNQIEFNNLKRYQDTIKNLLIKYGYDNYEVEIILNLEKNKKIVEEIEKSFEVDSSLIKKEIKEEVKKEAPIKYAKPKKDDKITKIKDIIYEIDGINIEGDVFGVDYFESSKTDFKIITLKVTDYTDSIYVKIFSKDAGEYKSLVSTLKTGKRFRFYGNVRDDKYSKEMVFMARPRDIFEVEIENKNEIKDEEEEKRVELHAHTFMSQMDGLVSATDLAKRALKFGHKAIAITDHNGVQSFPDAYKFYKKNKPFKLIYGTELSLIDDSIDIVLRENDNVLLDNTYVVFDFETTGFNAGGEDSIIEVGAVKIFNGEIIDRFDKLINPGKKLKPKIIELTNITDDMLKDCPDEETVIKEFIEWVGNAPMVAHNAKFDASFLEMAYQKYNLGEFENPLIDTLELDRAMYPSIGRHSLSALVKRFEIPFDEDSHHRADYDAEATALIFHKMMKELSNRNIEKMSDLNRLIDKNELHTLGNTYHFTALVKNKTGLKNLFKMVSYANTKYFYKTPRILRSEIENLREGLLIGSSCLNGEVFIQARSKSDEELSNIMSFYDYIEVQPKELYAHLIDLDDFSSMTEIEETIKKIIRVAKDAGKIVVATGDVHHLEKSDKIYREIIINQKVPGGGLHPLNKKNIKEIPSMHLRTTKEMLDSFDFLDSDLRKEIVITNTNKIADMIEEVEVIIDTGGVPFSPKMENSVETVKELVYSKAKSIYGENLPELIETRLQRELDGIIGGGYDVIYLIAQKLVKKSNDDGYVVGSRGSVGSSLVATMMGITEVNPLPAHYVCPSCHKTIFEENGRAFSMDYSSGYDLPDRVCVCGTNFKKEGQDMPFETFLGFKADKVPDIDLNFSSEYQWRAHDYTKVLFGEDFVYRAGTVGTVADKTAYGFVKGYLEDKGITLRGAEIERLAMGCTGVKRTTGQHPGGIVVIPDYMDIFDFTPYQYPADDQDSRWYTTHFDYHAIDECVLKLDILGHDDPTVLKMLQDLSGINIEDIPMDDKDVLSLFSSPEVLGVTKEDIMCETGSLGLPEVGTKFVLNMLTETKPKTFGELVKISGLSHGTDVWANNAQELIQNNTVPFKEVIGCRDDIMVYLINNGMEPIDAFKIMEFVRKGKPSKDPEGWAAFKEKMEAANIAPWYIESCRRIKYMFPKAHATAYIMMCCRVAWFKVHQPINYYAAYFSVRCADFDIDAMIKGYDSIKRRLIELNEKGYDATNKESSIADVLASALEATARGFKFSNLDLYRSHYKNFIIDDDGKTLIPPFRCIDGLGETVAKNIYEEALKHPFISIEDFQKRTKSSTTLTDKLRLMGLFEGLPESSQLTLF